MSKLSRNRNACRATIAIACLAVAWTGLAIADSLDEPRRACADWDLKLLSLIEQAGNQRTVQPERIFIIFQSAMSARKLCDRGDFEDAHNLYEALTQGLFRRPH